MNKDEILKTVLNKEDKILVSNVLDKYKKYEKTNISTYTNFLDMRQSKMIENILKRERIDYKVYKAHEECEKSIIYFGDYNDFITIYQIKISDISHKDVLGTLFSLGYNQDTIGDIFVNDDVTYVTNLTRLNTFLETSLYMIKNKRVELEKTLNIFLREDRFIYLKIVIPSYRIDAIVSKLAHTSRNDVLKLIKDKMVLLNMQEISEPNKIVNIGDIISIRRVGKFIINKELSKSRKDNYFIEIKKYN